ncbi:MerR family transcriptional regulator [Immundisolibacter sp.]|uniref:MerR family transcriptional regulator n=1 Tax=Immundisolibacter sp. TaxID=1934948 RepID=UPI00356955A2
MEISHLSIAALALETGIAKDTLRMWERRYGFPQPVRNPRGERRYPAQQVARLRQVRRLMDQGMRPGQVLTLSAEALEQAAKLQPTIGDIDPTLLDVIKRHDDNGLRQELRTRLLRDGLRQFVTHAAPSMLTGIGNGWAQGDLEVFEEHHFSIQLDTVLREAIAQLPVGIEAPRVLLTTLPGEAHTLGLMLALALMRLEGAACIWLGAQTPESQIAAAARAYRTDIVALSFSECFDPGAVRIGVRQLRLHLPVATELWCGGRSALRLKRPPAGVTIFKDLDQLAQQLCHKASGARID